MLGGHVCGQWLNCAGADPRFGQWKRQPRIVHTLPEQAKSTKVLVWVLEYVRTRRTQLMIHSPPSFLWMRRRWCQIWSNVFLQVEPIGEYALNSNIIAKIEDSNQMCRKWQQINWPVKVDNLLVYLFPLVWVRRCPVCKMAKQRKSSRAKQKQPTFHKMRFSPTWQT